MPSLHRPSFHLLRCLLLATCASISLIAPAGAAVDSALSERVDSGVAPVETSTRVDVLLDYPQSILGAGSITTPNAVAPPRSPMNAPSLQANPTRASVPVPAQEILSEIPIIKTIDLTATQSDLWQRVRNGFSMSNLDSPLVADRQAWYLNRPELLRTSFNRSRRYLYYIVGELEKRGMPTELALLPIVESSYNPMANSPARASGIWQFIPSTGKNYHLEQNWWIDQRRDIIASTGAALDYLQAVYEMQGDWHLALASYNWGEYAVARAIAKNKAKHLPTDYAHINMPNETRNYVPKLQALKNILAQPHLFGIQIDPIPNQPYFDTVDKTANMDVSLAAKLAEMPLDEFLALNPSYNRPIMPAGKGSPQVVLPTGKVQTFLTNLQNHEEQEKPLSNWRTYTLKKGDRLDKVASRFSLTSAHLKQINGITSKTRTGPGTTLLVPDKHAPDDAKLLSMDMPSPSADAPKSSRHGEKSKTSKVHKASRHDRKTVAHGGKSKPAKHTASAGHKRPATHRGASVKKHKKH